MTGCEVRAGTVVVSEANARYPSFPIRWVTCTQGILLSGFESRASASSATPAC